MVKDLAVAGERAWLQAGTGDSEPQLRVREFFRYLVSAPEVQAAFRRGIVDGDRGALQAFLGAAAYVIGKPRETQEVDLGPRLAKLLLLAQDRVAERRKAKLVPVTSGAATSPSGISGADDPGDPAA